jgi:glycosyltransferase involved in cell wall biosynthesis
VKVTVVSGIWPPDVGGPAVHAPALARFLVERGHYVEVVTTADRAPTPESFRIDWVPRRLPPGARHAAASATIARSARRTDIVYATSMIRRAAGGATAARRPYVVKLVADEAYERAQRAGVFGGTLEAFQEWEGDARVRALRVTRTAALRRAAHVFVPSAYLRRIALGWGLDEAHVSVLPNPAPAVGELPLLEGGRPALAADTSVALAFAGRLTSQKDLGVLLEAVAAVPSVTLALLGDGPERERLEAVTARLGIGDRVQFLGGGDRADVLRLFAAAEAAVLSSSWENFPHTVVEALAVGTPVIATAVGGVPEIIRDGENGLLVPARDPAAFAAALLRFAGDAALRQRLHRAAAPSVEALGESQLLARVEEKLADVIAR